MLVTLAVFHLRVSHMALPWWLNSETRVGCQHGAGHGVSAQAGVLLLLLMVRILLISSQEPAFVVGLRVTAGAAARLSWEAGLELPMCLFVE